MSSKFEENYEKLKAMEAVDFEKKLSELIGDGGWSTNKGMAVAWDSFILVTNRSKPKDREYDIGQFIPNSGLSKDSTLKALLEAINKFEKVDENGFIYFKGDGIKGAMEKNQF